MQALPGATLVDVSPAFAEMVLVKGEEELALVDAVTAADVKRVADELLSGTMQMSVIGPFSRDSAFRLAIGA